MGFPSEASPAGVALYSCINQVARLYYQRILLFQNYMLGDWDVRHFTDQQGSRKTIPTTPKKVHLCGTKAQLLRR